MLFEAEDPAEVDEYYQNRLTTLHGNAYGQNELDYDEMRRKINSDYAHDIDVLRYRLLHRKAWLKHKDKVIFEDEQSQEEESKPETPTADKADKPIEIIECKAVEIINRDLLTSPTEVGSSIDEADEE